LLGLGLSQYYDHTISCFALDLDNNYAASLMGYNQWIVNVYVHNYQQFNYTCIGWRKNFDASFHVNAKTLENFGRLGRPQWIPNKRINSYTYSYNVCDLVLYIVS